MSDRISQLPNAKCILDKSGSQFIVNAIDDDSWLGVKFNARVLRWMVDGYLMRQNNLGYVYMEIRDK